MSNSCEAFTDFLIVNANHQGAAPYSDKYPYTGAKNGVPGSQKGGIKVRLESSLAYFPG
jgi:hypothetical protein